jgi:hypothetical protein
MSSLRKLFQSAVKLDLNSVRPVGNLELAWLALRNDAEFAARRAISLDPGFAPAKRILDLTLKRVVISPKPPQSAVSVTIVGGPPAPVTPR